MAASELAAGGQLNANWRPTHKLKLAVWFQAIYAGTICMLLVFASSDVEADLAFSLGIVYNKVGHLNTR